MAPPRESQKFYAFSEYEQFHEDRELTLEECRQLKKLAKRQEDMIKALQDESEIWKRRTTKLKNDNRNLREEIDLLPNDMETTLKKIREEFDKATPRISQSVANHVISSMNGRGLPMLPALEYPNSVKADDDKEKVDIREVETRSVAVQTEALDTPTAAKAEDKETVSKSVGTGNDVTGPVENIEATNDAIAEDLIFPSPPETMTDDVVNLNEAASNDGNGYAIAESAAPTTTSEVANVHNIETDEKENAIFPEPDPVTSNNTQPEAVGGDEITSANENGVVFPVPVPSTSEQTQTQYDDASIDEMTLWILNNINVPNWGPSEILPTSTPLTLTSSEDMQHGTVDMVESMPNVGVKESPEIPPASAPLTSTDDTKQGTVDVVEAIPNAGVKEYPEIQPTVPASLTSVENTQQGSVHVFEAIHNVGVKESPNTPPASAPLTSADDTQQGTVDMVEATLYDGVKESPQQRLEESQPLETLREKGKRGRGRRGRGMKRELPSDSDQGLGVPPLKQKRGKRELYGLLEGDDFALTVKRDWDMEDETRKTRSRSSRRGGKA